MATSALHRSVMTSLAAARDAVSVRTTLRIARATIFLLRRFITTLPFVGISDVLAQNVFPSPGFAPGSARLCSLTMGSEGAAEVSPLVSKKRLWTQHLPR